MAILLQKWETLIATTLNPPNEKLRELTDESIDLLINESKEEKEKIRSLLIEAIVDKPKVSDKQQLVQLNQAMLIRLLDKLHAYKQAEGLSNRLLFLCNSVGKHLEEVLDFIQDFFSNYFDRNEKVPIGYLVISLEDLCKQLEIFEKKSAANKRIDPRLIEILVDNFNKFCGRKVASVTYNELMYQKELMIELLTENTLQSEMSIKQVLFFFNFNDDDYISYLFQKLNTLIEILPSKKEKIIALRLEQKNINQLRSKLNSYLSAKMPPLKEQVNQWIEEEIKYLERDQIPDTANKKDAEVEDKIHTSLSVSKLALLIRLMVIDKIIVNRVIAQTLRIVAKTLTTLQQENISFGSLETKYHNPDKGTITAVKEMLFRWISILNKL